MRHVLILASLAAFSAAPTTLLIAAEQPSVEERLAALEEEVAQLRAQLDTETLAKAIAEQMLIAERKAQEPPSPEEAVAAFAEEAELDQETATRLTGTLVTQREESETLMEQMRKGEIPREDIREQFSAMRERHQEQLSALLSEDQIEALREAQRPPASRGRGGRRGGPWGGRGGPWGGGGRPGGDRGEGGPGGDRGGRAEF